MDKKIVVKNESKKRDKRVIGIVLVAAIVMLAAFVGMLAKGNVEVAENCKVVDFEVDSIDRGNNSFVVSVVGGGDYDFDVAFVGDNADNIIVGDTVSIVVAKSVQAGQSGVGYGLTKGSLVVVNADEVFEAIKLEFIVGVVLVGLIATLLIGSFVVIFLYGKNQPDVFELELSQEIAATSAKYNFNTIFDKDSSIEKHARVCRLILLLSVLLFAVGVCVAAILVRFNAFAGAYICGGIAFCAAIAVIAVDVGMRSKKYYQKYADAFLDTLTKEENIDPFDCANNLVCKLNHSNALFFVSDEQGNATGGAEATVFTKDMNLFALCTYRKSFAPVAVWVASDLNEDCTCLNNDTVMLLTPTLYQTLKDQDIFVHGLDDAVNNMMQNLIKNKADTLVSYKNGEEKSVCVPKS